MNEEETYGKSDFTRAIDKVICDLQSWDSPLRNGGSASHLVTKLIEARMISLLLVNDSKNSPSKAQQMIGYDTRSHTDPKPKKIRPSNHSKETP